MIVLVYRFFQVINQFLDNDLTTIQTSPVIYAFIGLESSFPIRKTCFLVIVNLESPSKTTLSILLVNNSVEEENKYRLFEDAESKSVLKHDGWRSSCRKDRDGALCQYDHP